MPSSEKKEMKRIDRYCAISEKKSNTLKDKKFLLMT